VLFTGARGSFAACILVLALGLGEATAAYWRAAFGQDRRILGKMAS
jgi:hypothetical protein